MGALTGDISEQYDAVCISECPVGLTGAASTDNMSKLDCLVNDVVSSCPYKLYNTIQMMGYCLPEPSSTADLINSVADQLGQADNLAKYLIDFSNTWGLILVMTFAAFLITLVYVWSLQMLAKPLLYISLMTVLFLIIAMGGYSWYLKDAFEPTSNEYLGMFFGAILLWVVAILFVCFICCQWDNIVLAAAILEASSDYLSSHTRIVFMPVTIYFMMIPIIGCWMYSSAHLMSIGEPIFVKKSFIGEMIYADSTRYMFLFMLFGIFWIIAFLDALQMFVVASTTCMWYFSGEGSDDVDKYGVISIRKSLEWAMFYHLGSLSLGAFLVAVVTLIRVIFEYLVWQTQKVSGTNPIQKMVIACSRCLLWSLDCCIKFINKNAFIQVALHSKSFCASAYDGFYLVIRHAGKFSASGIAGAFIAFLGKGAIIALNVWITILIINSKYPEVKSPMVPAVCVGCITYVVATLFLTLFEFSGKAILHCFILD